MRPPARPYRRHHARPRFPRSLLAVLLAMGALLMAVLLRFLLATPAPVLAPPPAVPPASSLVAQAEQVSGWEPTPTTGGLAAAMQPVAASATPHPAPAPTPTADAATLRVELDRSMAELTAGRLFHGAVLVARDDEILLAQGYGQADPLSGAQSTTTTRFRLASVSKQFTAAAILRLQAQGLLATSDPICRYLPDCPEAWQAITIRQLLNHTSGLPNYTDFADYEAGQMNPATPAQLVARFRDMPLTAEPGLLFRYTNSGYVLLGMIIEQASGRSYAEYLKQAIFGPLGMADSGVARGTQPGPNEARGCQAFAQVAPPLDPSTLFAAGDLYSTAEDLFRWSQALLRGQFLPTPLRTEMLTPGNGDYGYGWWITRPGGVLRYGHSGLMDGASNVILYYPERRVTVIVLSNMGRANAVGIGEHLAGIVLR